MAKSEKEMIEKYKARMKRQNEKIKENYDRVSATLPNGTIDRIKALGLTINGVINESVLAYLDCMEEAQAEEEQNRTAQNQQKCKILHQIQKRRRLPL